ncbi:MAG: DUF975 family protein [Candidatus Nomurabacteria bacterium]|jgi:uncharacterized membrane protein|nr:DUF975 family protein [Candidatus Nomurabacteria bacterium]
MQFDRAAAKKDAKTKIKTGLGTLLLITLIYSVISAVNVPIIVWLVIGCLSIGFSAVYLKKVRGTNVNVGDLFDGFRGDHGASRGFFGWCRQFFFTLFWSLLFLIPGIVKSLAYSQMWFLLADHPEMSAKDAQKISIAWMKGHKSEYFVLLLSFLGWILLPALALAIIAAVAYSGNVALVEAVTLILGVAYFAFSLVYLTPFIEATAANYYLYLKALNEASDKQSVANPTKQPADSVTVSK